MDEHIEKMWRMVKVVRNLEDSPLAWKLTEPFIEALEAFLKVKRPGVLNLNFLDAGIDMTTSKDVLIGYKMHYEFDLFSELI